MLGPREMPRMTRGAGRRRDLAVRMGPAVGFSARKGSTLPRGPSCSSALCCTSGRRSHGAEVVAVAVARPEAGLHGAGPADESSGANAEADKTGPFPCASLRREATVTETGEQSDD